MKKKRYGFAAAVPAFFFVAAVFLAPVAKFVQISAKNQTLPSAEVVFSSEKSGEHLINDGFLSAMTDLREAMTSSAEEKALPGFFCQSAPVTASADESDALTPPALNADFVEKIANECPAVSKKELMKIINTTWRICREEKYHFMRALAQMRAESDFNPALISSAGAQGLMQIMPKTAEFMGFKEVKSIENNIRCGVRYMRFVKRFALEHTPRENWLASLASYNSGPGRYMEMARRAKKRYGSTKWNYVAKSYRRRFRRVRGQKLPETLIYINRNLNSLGRFQKNLFESTGLMNSRLAGMVRVPPSAMMIASVENTASAVD